MTALVGVFLMLAAVLRLGFVANFISAPVLTGFKAGIGLVIVLDQVPKLLGVHLVKQGFFLDLLTLVHRVPETSLMTLAGHCRVVALQPAYAGGCRRRPDSAGISASDDSRRFLCFGSLILLAGGAL
jgi:SulP family sulfate permease